MVNKVTVFWITYKSIDRKNYLISGDSFQSKSKSNVQFYHRSKIQTLPWWSQISMSMCLSLQLSMQSSFCGLSSTSYYSGRYVQMLTPQTVGIFNLISKTKYLGFESAELVALGRKMKMDWPELRSKAEALASSPHPPLATTNRFTSIIKTNKNLGSTRWFSHCTYDNLAL